MYSTYFVQYFADKYKNALLSKLLCFKTHLHLLLWSLFYQ
jgi:hypothetical protein